MVSASVNKSDVKAPKNQPGYYTTESLYIIIIGLPTG